MGLQFYFGAAGAGKSRRLHQDIVEWSLREPDKNFLFVVPDQFTMHTQAELVGAHPRRGILNIDVLSFGRLSHRVFGEVGGNDKKVLDDTGKSLVLRKLAADIRGELPIIGKSLAKPGYIAEVKSAISEFMQYGIGPKELAELTAFAEKRGALSAKLQDLQRLYRAFLDYIREEFITTEETLDLLRASLPKSRIVRGSVVIFDGFTGFTPIQYRVIGELMGLTDRVMVSILMGDEADPFGENKEQELFYLSKKTVGDLCRLAKEDGVSREADVYLRQGQKKEPPNEPGVGLIMPESESIIWAESGECRHGTGPIKPESKPQKLPTRFADNKEMAHLEKNLFRYPIRAYEEQPKGDIMPLDNNIPEGDNMSSNNDIPKGMGASSAIVMAEAATVAEEVRQTCIRIKELTLTAGYQYREIAVVTGEMDTYAGYMEREAAKYGIPLYLDRTRGILLNPFTEFIRSALMVVNKNFSYETVFHYLRSGFADCEQQTVDELENYIIGCGIRGKKSWSALFTRKSRQWESGRQAEYLAGLNETREKIVDRLRPLCGKLTTAGEMTKALYDFIVAGRIQQKLAAYEEYFKGQGDYVRAREYGQIYRLVMELLEQVYGLLAAEPMTLQEFADILDAGFGEIKVGTIPQNVDRVVVGDMERTRLNQIKVLFFMGVNDGNIPGSGKKGGLISDLDREFLKASPWELAPTPRQQMYIQRLYLYMNMTKPANRLYLSYARVNSEGKGLRPSYLVDTMRKLFPLLKTEKWEAKITLEQLFGISDSIDIFTATLRNFAAGRADSSPENREILTVLGRLYRQDEGYRERVGRLAEEAFLHYTPRPLSKAMAEVLYGSLLEHSVSRLEQYAACAYAHFLQYGLALREREEYGFEAVDLGNVFHGVLEIFAGKLAEHHFNWFDFPLEEGLRLLREALDTYAAEYGDTILFSSARNGQMINRIYRILTRTVKTLQQQLRQGAFLPERFEVSFSRADSLESVDIALSPEEKIRLRGRIDRIDTCEDDDHVYVKVIDYKSGHKRFDLAALYYGLQLQLVVYMNVAMEMTGREHPDKKVVPAALLYYHVSDPMIREDGSLTPEEINRRLLAELRTTGVVNDKEEVIDRLDRDFSGKSLVVPVERKKDGSFSKRSGVLAETDFAVMSRYVNHKIRQFGQEIKAGNIAVNPYESKDGQACTYCAYQAVCGFDPKIPGYQGRRLETLSGEDAMERMRRTIL